MNLSAVGEYLQVAGAIQEALDEHAMLIQQMAPTFGDTARKAMNTMGIPVSQELLKLVEDEGTKQVIENVALSMLSAKSTAAEAVLTEKGQKAHRTIAKAKAVVCKAQVDALVEAGFTRKEAMELLKELIIAQAMRDAKTSFPTASKSKK